MNPGNFTDLVREANMRKSDWERREKIDNEVRGKVYKNGAELDLKMELLW